MTNEVRDALTKRDLFAIEIFGILNSESNLNDLTNWIGDRMVPSAVAEISIKAAYVLADEMIKGSAANG